MQILLMSACWRGVWSLQIGLRWSRCLKAVESPVNFTQIFVALKETFLRKANSPLEIGNLTIEFRLPKFDPKIESQNQID